MGCGGEGSGAVSGALCWLTFPTVCFSHGCRVVTLWPNSGCARMIRLRLVAMSTYFRDIVYVCMERHELCLFRRVTTTKAGGFDGGSALMAMSGVGVELLIDTQVTCNRGL
jgi:hypothetical protein